MNSKQLDLFEFVIDCYHEVAQRNRNENISNKSLDILLELGQMERCETLAKFKYDPMDKSSLLCKLARKYAEKNDVFKCQQILDTALFSIEQIENTYEQSRLRSCVIQVFAKVNLCERATSIITQHSFFCEPEHKVEALVAIAEKLITVGQVEKAITLLDSADVYTTEIDDLCTKCVVLTKIAREFIRAQQLHKAEKILERATEINRISDFLLYEVVSDTLITITQLWLELAQEERSMQLLKQVTELTSKFDDFYTKIESMSLVAEELICRGRKELGSRFLGKTLECYHRIERSNEDLYDEVKALLSMGRVFGKIGDWQHFGELLNKALYATSLESSCYAQCETLTLIAKELAEQNLPEANKILSKTVTIARSIQASRPRSQSLTLIGLEFAKNGQKQQAQELFEEVFKINLISDVWDKNELRIQLAKKLAKAGQISKSFQVIESIHNQGIQVKTLVAVANEISSHNKRLTILDRAIVQIKRIGDSREKEMVLAETIQAFIVWGSKSSDLAILERALQMVNDLPPHRQSFFSVQVACELLKMDKEVEALQLLEKGIGVAREMKCDIGKDKLIKAIIRSMSQNLESRQVLVLLEEVAEIVLLINDLSTKIYLQLAILKVYYQANILPQASQLLDATLIAIHEVPSLYYKIEQLVATSKTLEASSHSLKSIDILEEAFALTSVMDHPYEKSKSLHKIADAFFRANQKIRAAEVWEEAFKTAHKVKSHRVRDDLLVSIARKLPISESTKALEITNEIVGLIPKSKLLTILAQNSAKEEEAGLLLEKAIAVAETIPCTLDQEVIFAGIGKSMAAAKKISDSLTIANRLQRSECKMEVLLAISEEYGNVEMDLRSIFTVAKDLDLSSFLKVLACNMKNITGTGEDFYLLYETLNLDSSVYK